MFRKAVVDKTSQRGKRKIFVTTAAGVRVYIDPYEKDGRIPALDIPVGRHFMRKLFARYNILREQRKFVDVTQVREMLRYLQNTHQQQGVQMAKAVRLLASQMMNGFEVVELDTKNVYNTLRKLGIQLTIDGRKVKIEDSSGVQEYVDDFYFTATKWIFSEVIGKYKLGLNFIDQRERNSVKVLFGDNSDKTMVAKFADGSYLKNPRTRFWGGQNLSGLRKVVFNEMLIVGEGFKIVKMRSRKVLKWTEAETRSDWVEVIERVVSHDFDKKDTEKLKPLISRADFNAVKRYLREVGALSGFIEKKELCDYVYDALERELPFDRDKWMSFIVRGCNNLLRYRGDRFDKLLTAFDEVSSVVSTDGISNADTLDTVDTTIFEDEGIT